MLLHPSKVATSQGQGALSCAARRDMPTFVVETNLAKDAFPEGWMVEATQLIANLLKKPERVRSKTDVLLLRPIKAS